MDCEKIYEDIVSFRNTIFKLLKEPKNYRKCNFVENYDACIFEEWCKEFPEKKKKLDTSIEDYKKILSNNQCYKSNWDSKVDFLISRAIGSFKKGNNLSMHDRLESYKHLHNKLAVLPCSELKNKKKNAFFFRRGLVKDIDELMKIRQCK